MVKIIKKLKVIKSWWGSKESDEVHDFKSGKDTAEENEMERGWQYWWWCWGIHERSWAQIKTWDDIVKFFSTNEFQVEMCIDNSTNLTGDFVIKLVIDVKFEEFRNTLRDEKLENFFKSGCFGHFDEGG